MIVKFILCFFTAIALNIRFEISEELSQMTGESSLSKIFCNFQLSLSGTMAAATLLFAALVLLEVYLHKKQAKRTFLLYIICFLLAIVWAMGESFRRTDSLSLLYADAGQMIKSLVYITGITWLLAELAALLTVFLESGHDWQCKNSRLRQLYARHPFSVTFTGLFLCWLPNLILSYPAAMCVDVWKQILQFYGEQPFTAHHPPAHTILTGLSEELGQLLGSGNLGLFLYIFIQTVMFAFIFTYMLDTMRKLSAPVWLRALSFITAITSPYYTQYLGTIVKDTIYSYCILLFVIEVVYMLILKNTFWLSKRHLLLLTLSIIGSILFRNNGKYVIYPMIVLIILMLIVQNKGNTHGQRRRVLVTAIAVFVISVGISSGTQKFMTNYYQIEAGSIREALSLPFQQTARYVKEHGDEVTQDEKTAIQAVLGYKTLAENYDPRISDPVKRTYKEKATTQDLIRYLQVWFQQGLKHPVTYIEATMNQNYYLLYPLIANDTIYDATEPENDFVKPFAQQLGIHEIPAIQKLDENRTVFNKMLFTLPVLGLLSNIAFYNLILIYLCYLSVKRRLASMVLILMPLLLSDAIIVLAPVIMGHPRYAFPIVYSIPIAVAGLLYFIKEKKTS